MIKIDKGSEPNSWMLIRRTPGMTYDASDKTDLRASLLKEQGFICGYCMRRVNAANSRIEHLKPQSLSLRQGKPEETLDYSNMIVCCDGDINGSNAEKQFHCDRHKKETPIHFTPFTQHPIDSISYSSKTGEIKSSDSIINDDINKVLNLNLGRLKENRLAVLRGVIVMLGTKKDWKKSEIQSLLNNYISKDANGQKKAYCGIVIWFLSSRLRHL